MKDAEKTADEAAQKNRKFRIARESFWAVWAVSSVLLAFALTMFSAEAERLGITGDWYLWIIIAVLTSSQGVFGAQNVAGKALLGRFAVAKAKVITAIKKDKGAK